MTIREIILCKALKKTGLEMTQSAEHTYKVGNFEIQCINNASVLRHPFFVPRPVPLNIFLKFTPRNIETNEIFYLI